MPRPIKFANAKMNAALGALGVEDQPLTARLSSAIDHLIHIDDRDVPIHAMPEFTVLKNLLFENYEGRSGHRKLRDISSINAQHAVSSIVSLSVVL